MFQKRITSDLEEVNKNYCRRANERENNRFLTLTELLNFADYNLPPKIVALDLGCGTGSALPTLSKISRTVVALDISLEHLLLAKKFLFERNISNVILVAGCAEYLPLRDGLFSYVNATDVIEHVWNQGRVLKEVYRVQSHNSIFWFSTPNRFLLLKEPHVRVWGVGFLPRRMQKKYVWMIKKVPYQVRSLSYFELRRMLSRVFNHYKIYCYSEIISVIKPSPETILANFVGHIKKHHLLLSIFHLIERYFYSSFQTVAHKD